MTSIFRLSTLLFGVISIVSLSSCERITRKFHREDPSQTIVTQTRQIGGMQGITASPGVIVTYVQGEMQPVKVKGPENMVKYLKIERRNNGDCIFEVEDADRFNCTKKAQLVNVIVQSPDVHDFKAVGMAFVNIPSIDLKEPLNAMVTSGGCIIFGKVSSPSIKMEAYSGGSIEASSVVSDILEAGAWSNSSIRLAGESEFVKYEVFSSEIHAGNLKADRGEIEILHGAIFSSIKNPSISKQIKGKFLNTPPTELLEE